jgi:adenine C2-methylase RlmN of 23S rRNA A2503 and tRNA A37
VEALDNHMSTSRSGGSLVPADESMEEKGKWKGRSKKDKDRKAMIQYTMLTGPTSTFESAHELGKLCEGKNIIVNLMCVLPPPTARAKRAQTRPRSLVRALRTS